MGSDTIHLASTAATHPTFHLFGHDIGASAVRAAGRWQISWPHCAALMAAALSLLPSQETS